MSVSARPVRVLLAAGAAALLLAGAAHAASPFGVGLPEPAPSGGGFLPGVFAAIARWQSAFYKDLTATLRAMKSDGTAGFWLCAVSFLYGVLHAAGPGHGKAVVSAWVLANRETARNGALLAMVSALAQGAAAVLLVTVAALVLGATSIAMTNAAEIFEIGSFALIVALGLLLVWRKIVRPLRDLWAERFAPVMVVASMGPVAFAGDLSAATAGRGQAVHRHAGAAGHSGGHAHDHGHDHHHHHHGAHDHHHHHHGDGLVCDCGHVHGVTPAAATGRLDLSKAWTAIAAVGMRPCTGALIVLVFSLSQGLYWAGIAATFAMAIGTGITVAGLTLLAVAARAFALRLAGGGESQLAGRIHAVAEGAGAVVVLLFGTLMLGASLVG